MVYLVDTSIWSWADRTPGSDLSNKLAERFDRDEVATCPVVILESLHRGRSARECEQLLALYFADVPSFPVTATACERAIEVQLELGAHGHGNHRRPAADFLLAAAAEEAGPEVVLWFYDKDLRIICEHTGQPHEAESRA